MDRDADKDHGIDDLIGQSPCMRRLQRQVVQLAKCDVNVLLQGESGTGKELVARGLHRLGRRAAGPFVGVNCAAIHDGLLESELFGHAAGAFTGAGEATLGLLRAADGGTVLLDEVGDMGSALQSKLLRVLEEREVVPVGGTRAVPIDVRVVAATHRDLAEAVSQGTFRQDLYYRLNVVRLSIPPLRQRPEDIEPLAVHLLARIALALDVAPKKLTPAALEVLLHYDWPGNVRQLGNAIQRGYALGCGPALDVEDLPEELLSDVGSGPDDGFPTLREATRLHVRRALELAEGVRSRAARMLGIDRKSLWRMMQRHSLH